MSDTTMPIMKFLDESSISPPSGSVSSATIRLTYFDLAELMLDSPLHGMYFYDLKVSTTHFMQSILPDLKHSLSLALEKFYPLAGHLIWSPESSAPQLVYADGDSVSFTTIESDTSFDHITGNHPRETTDFIPLSSQLLPKSSVSGGNRYPVFAARVTLFPNSGICVGITMSHAVSDAMANNLFVKYWASLCRSLQGGAPIPGLLSNFLPSFDRSKIVDPNGIERAYMNYMKEINISQQSFDLPADAIINPTDPSERKVVAVYVLDLPTIEKLKKWVYKQMIEKNKKEPPFHLTTLVVTNAFMWVCMIKAVESDDNVTKTSKEHFIVAADCRSRMDPPLPATYFGNCLSFCYATVSNKDLVGDNGVVLAAEAIGNAIKTLLGDVLATAKNMVEVFNELLLERLSGCACTPKMKLYETDFGWGKPKKFEPVIIPGIYSGCQYLFMRENGGDGNGGMEFGLALTKNQMEAFTSIFEDALKKIEL